MAGTPVKEKPIDLLSGLKEELADLMHEKFGINVTFSLIEEKKYSSGDCKVW